MNFTIFTWRFNQLQQKFQQITKPQEYAGPSQNQRCSRTESLKLSCSFTDRLVRSSVRSSVSSVTSAIHITRNFRHRKRAPQSASNLSDETPISPRSPFSDNCITQRPMSPVGLWPYGTNFGSSSSSRRLPILSMPRRITRTPDNLFIATHVP